MAKVIRIGLGEVISNWGTYEGKPCLFIEPVENPGVVGELAHPEGDPQHARTSVSEDGVILQFHGKDGARVLIEDINSALQAKR